MVRDLFKEKLEYERTKLNTKLGWFNIIFGGLIWGFVIVRYTNQIYSYILNFLPFSGLLQEYISYLVFGLILIPVGLLITLILTKIYKLFFKNGRIL